MVTNSNSGVPNSDDLNPMTGLQLKNYFADRRLAFDNVNSLVWLPNRISELVLLISFISGRSEFALIAVIVRAIFSYFLYLTYIHKLTDDGFNNKRNKADTLKRMASLAIWITIFTLLIQMFLSPYMIFLVIAIITPVFAFALIKPLLQQINILQNIYRCRTIVTNI